MTTKHTAGPWTYKDSFELVVIQKNNPEAEAICEVTGNPAEQFANAQLIAAAPELLAVLMHISERIGTVRPNDAFCQALKQIADEAIKTAVKQ